MKKTIQEKTFSLGDIIIQHLYRIAFYVLKLSWQLFPRHTRGTQVMLWVKNEILLVRSSYRDVYTFPGGYINRNEKPEQAAKREMAEEVNVDVPLNRMTLNKKIEYYEYGRDAIDYIFNSYLDHYPALEINNREIIDAVFVSPAQALSMPLHSSAREMIECSIKG